MMKRIRRCREQMNQEIREKYWMPMEGRHKTGAWEALDAGYTESHRAYHTWEHVAGLLEELSEFSYLSTRSDIIAVSVFWHDVAYKTQNQDGSPRPDYENVRDSGELFRQYTLLSKPDADAVHDLIMATANHLQARAEKQYYPGFADDLDLFLDFDGDYIVDTTGTPCRLRAAVGGGAVVTGAPALIDIRLSGTPTWELYGENPLAMTVNLDAMIPREDFEIDVAEGQILDSNRPGNELYLNQLTREGRLASLRKPSFQRETTAWKPEIVAGFVKSVVDGDVIPAIIMWRSPRTGTIFVIDGAHRLSTLIAWINDDYGDRDMSRDFYGNQIRKEQEQTASIIRKLIDKEVGSYRQLKAYAQAPVTAPDDATLLRSRRISVDPIYLQWVVGDASAAEKSFMRINSTAVAISDTETALIQSRRQPGGLAVRAIMRAGTGHEYWSAFPGGKKTEIKELAADIYNQLIFPLAEYPVVTLDLPAMARGYSADSLKTILDLVNFINSGASGPKVPDDVDGSITIECLKMVKKATERVFGRHSGSLALHPGVYCYNEKGRFIPKAFIGTVGFVSWLEQKDWFAKFTKNRAKFEEFVLKHRGFVTHIGKSQGSGGRRGVPAIVRLYEFVLGHIAKGDSEDTLVKAIYADDSLGFLKGATKEEDTEQGRFRKEDEAAVLLHETLRKELKCPICQARIYRKHVSRDHVVRREDGGTSTISNLQLTHPYCNTGYKEKLVHAGKAGF